jgi:hypothetical protein
MMFFDKGLKLVNLQKIENHSFVSLFTFKKF